MQEHFYFILSNLSALLFSVCASRAWRASTDSSLRLLVALTAYIFTITMILLVLGTIKCLNRDFVVACSLLLTTLAVVVSVKSRKATCNGLHKDHLEIKSKLPDIELAVGYALLAGYITCYAFDFLRTGTSLFSDDFAYHATATARWMQGEWFCIPRGNMTGYYPYNCELVSLWFILPYRQVGMVGLAGLFWILLLVVSVACVCRISGHSTSTVVLTAMLSICSPSIAWLSKTFSSADLAGTAMILAGIVFSASSISSSTPKARLVYGLYAGLAIGWSFGAKVSFVPAAAILSVLTVLACLRRYGANRAFCLATTLLAGATITGLYWYIKNWIITGNPLYPAALGPFWGPFSRQDQKMVTLAYFMYREPHSLQYWTNVLAAYVNWPYGLGFLSVAGYALAITDVLRGDKRAQYGDQMPRNLLLAAGLVLAVFHPWMPYSHGAGEVDGVLVPYPRYVVPSYLIGIILFSWAIDIRCKSHWFWYGIAIMAAATSWPTTPKRAIVAIVGAAVGLGILRLAHWKRYSPGTIRVAGCTGMAALFIVLSFLETRLQSLTDIGIASYGGVDRPIGKAWAALEELPVKSRVTCFVNKDWEFSSLFGRRLQLDAIEVLPNGTKMPALHEQGDKHTILAGANDVEIGHRLIENLVDSGVDYVLVSKWNGNDWPPQRSVLMESDITESVYDDGYSEIWKIEYPSRSSQ